MTWFEMCSLGDGRTNDSSLVVSMEINGIVYQGVLFAQAGAAAAAAAAASSATSNSSSNQQTGLTPARARLA